MDITRKTLGGRRRIVRRRPGPGRRRKSRLRLLAVLSVLLLAVVLIARHLHPILEAYGKNQAQWLSAQVINEAVTQVLADEQLSYSDLVSVSLDETGAVKAVEADVNKINQLKAAVTNMVLEKLQENRTLQTSVPLGTLIGGDWFSGWGPHIPLRVSVSGSAAATVHSEFSSAGINQTSHQITLDLTSNLVMAVAGYTKTVEVSSDFLVAETVLVGQVPDSYTEVDSGQADLLGKIFAYSRNSG